jgi:hypothetical protein
MNFKTIILVIGLYMIFISGFSLKFTRNQIQYKIEYTGLVWILLDIYTIIRYNSLEEPMQPICFTRTELY